MCLSLYPFLQRAISIRSKGISPDLSVLNDEELVLSLEFSTDPHIEPGHHRQVPLHTLECLLVFIQVLGWHAKEITAVLGLKTVEKHSVEVLVQR